MPKLNWAITYLLMVVLCILGGTRSASAQPYYALEYWGGPVMETFTIYPLYYGDWSQADIDAQQAYLQSLTAYISGVNAPAGQQPTIRQYGVNSASLAAAATASPTATPATLTQSEVATIILANQLSGNLPPYSSTTLIAVFLAHGFQLAGCDRCSYHASNSNTQIWLAVPHDTGAPYQLATAHEVFEAATDPVVDDQTSWGWLTGGYYPPNSSSLVNDEMVDECGANTITLNNLGIQIPEVTDNTGGVFLGDPSKTQPPGGTCSTTGYTSLDEIQVYGWTLSDFEAKYASLRPQGWRLYILQSYVQPNGQLLYNAVWRPAGETDEKEQYAATLSQFETEYDTLHPLGWRLYILDSYVQDGSVRFNAVWRPSDLPEKDNYQDTAAQFQSQRTSLYSDNWRPYIVQAYIPDGSVEYNAVWRNGVVDNKQLFAEVYSDYRAEYNKLWLEGWRLYILQSYVLSDGTDLFNAVFRPGNHGEIQYYGMPYSDYRAEYNKLWLEGWRLYILQSFVAGDGKVYYNAVWRQGTIDRPL